MLVNTDTMLARQVKGSGSLGSGFMLARIQLPNIKYMKMILESEILECLKLLK